MAVFDPRELERLTGLSAEDVRPLLQSYRDNQAHIRELMGELRSTLDCENAHDAAQSLKSLASLAHRLKSAARGIGAWKLAARCECLETAHLEPDAAAIGCVDDVLAAMASVDDALGHALNPPGRPYP